MYKEGPTDEVAMDLLVRRHGYKTHEELDDCEGCHRILALELIQRMNPSPSDAPVLAEWVLGEGFLS